MTHESHISAHDVHRRFVIGPNTIEVLKGITLDVLRGEKVFLRGASGAGKTSLLYTLAGLEKPNEGSVSIAGQDLYGLSPRRQSGIRNREMGYVFQNYSLLPELSAIENVMLPAIIGKRDSKERAESLLERVGLSERLGHRPTELSGGEQQRVAIARALINDPGVLFADEPTGNLDSKTGGVVMDILMNVIAEDKKTLLVVTHDNDLAKAGDRTLQLVDGRLAE